MAKSKAACLVLSLFLTVTFSITSVTARDWRTWPFSQNSPWNTPIGSNAQYATVSGIGSLGGGLNFADH
jgi:hypothetical protein